MSSRIQKARRFRRWYAMLFPVGLLLVGAFFCAGLTWIAAQSGGLSLTNSRRLTMEIATIGWLVMLGLHLLLSWWLSVQSASTGGQFLRRAGFLFRARMALVQKRLLSTTLTLAGLRVALLIAILLIALGGQALRVPFEGLSSVQAVGRRAPLVVALFSGVLLIFSVLGPLLQARYGAAVGGFAATLTRRSEDRVSLAMSGWFLSFLLDINLGVFVLWVYSNLNRIAPAMLSNTARLLGFGYLTATSNFDYVTRLGLQLLGVSIVLLVVIFRQALFTPLLLLWTQRRLARQEAS